MIKTILKYSYALAFGCMLLVGQQAHAIVLDFSSAIGAKLSFTGTATDDTFTFTDSTTAGAWFGKDFQITNSNGAGTSVGLYGNINGVYKINPPITIVGTKQSASVSVFSGPNTFSIFDGVTSLTGTVNWIDLYTDGTSGGINAGGSINLSGLAYAGTNSDLLAFLASSNAGTGVISFNFVNGSTLTQLTATGANNATSYSGNFASVPDGGSTVTLLGLAFMGAAVIRRKLKVS